MADYRSENAASKDRLFALLDSLAPLQLSLRLQNGWTVADALVHLAFWDSYCLDLLRSWKKGSTPGKSANIDAINAAIAALSSSIAPIAAIALTKQAAEAVDLEVESLSPTLAAAINASEHRYLLFRCWHRTAHLKTLESELG
ncbi:MAG: hypothetical protein P4K83_09305 [Terracidiphilus sp.]|nr:hypothetical protein [Terracidiphilus sp.]